MSSPNSLRRGGTGVIQDKWGAALDAGFQIVPNVLIRAQSQLELDAVDLVVLLNLLAHWWGKDDLPFIAASSIAKRMNVTTRTVERHLKKLEQKGFIRKPPARMSGEGFFVRGYDLTPTVEILSKAAATSLMLRAQRSQSRTSLNREEHTSPNLGPQVQSSGDAEPVQRVASSSPNGEGGGNPSPHVAHINDTSREGEDQLGGVLDLLPARRGGTKWEESLIGKACPVCCMPFESGHACKPRETFGDDALF